MTVKSWPFEFTDYATGRFIAREWFRPDSHTGDMWDEIDHRAGELADAHGVEIDIIGCTVMPSGRIGSRERVGMRVRPSHGGLMPSLSSQYN